MKIVHVGQEILKGIPAKEISARIEAATTLKNKGYCPEEILEKGFLISEENFEPEMVYCPFFI